MSMSDLRVLIVAEHASAQFGGEAALPLHYFRILRKRGIPAWLVVHERTRDELKAVLAEEFDRVYFVEDTALQRLLWQLSKPLHWRLSYITFGFAMRLLNQLTQRRILKKVIRENNITIIHQPIPVSPKEPSMIFGMGVPVVIGPMNGGIDYPPAFQYKQNRLVNFSMAIGRMFSDGLNLLMPGKRQAAALLVANPRTKAALPRGACANVIELVENGVDLSLWQSEVQPVASEPEPADFAKPDSQRIAKFVFIGRLIDWKAVDLLLIAFRRVAEQVPVSLEIIGDGEERQALEQQAAELGLLTSQSTGSIQPSLKGHVHFAGWLSQADCAQQLQQADALVLPSLLECGGAVVLEAMAMGVPVIATNWGGPADYLDHSCGVLVEPTSRQAFIEGLAAGMLQLAESPELCRALGKAGRMRVIKYFDWEVKGDEIVKIYRQVMKTLPAPPFEVTKGSIVNGAIR